MRPLVVLTSSSPIEYTEVLNLQRTLHANQVHRRKTENTRIFSNTVANALLEITDQASDFDYLIVCQHPAVITTGRKPHGLKDGNSPTSLPNKFTDAIPIIETERGGLTTLHNPGQLVAYPLIDLRNHKTDVGWYLRKLEKVIIEFLSFYGIHAFTIKDKTGVWVAGVERSDPCYELPPLDDTQHESKIAFIGVRLSRWCTMHGLSINISNSLEEFKLIDPCGFKNLSVTSLENELNRMSPQTSIASHSHPEDRKACADAHATLSRAHEISQLSFESVNQEFIAIFCQEFGYDSPKILSLTLDSIQTFKQPV